MGECSHQRRVSHFRLLVAFGLCAAAVICGMGSFYTLRSQEDRLFESQYNSIASQAMKAAVTDMNRKIRTGKVAAAIMSESFPDESDWPNVYLSGFIRIANLLISLENDRGLGYYPIVTPKNVDSFENHAREKFEEGGYPPNAGESSFGFGIWASDPSLNSSDYRYHDNTGETVYNSSYKIMTPMFQIGHVISSYLPFLMHNSHSEIRKGLSMDRVLDCTFQRPEKVANNSCGTMTPPLTFEKLNNAEPTSLYFHPIMAAHNATGPTVGAAAIGARWSDILRAVVPDFVHGVDIVVETESFLATYTIQNGNDPIFSSGDIHDPTFNSYCKSQVVFEEGLMASGTPPYTLHFYPRLEFSNQYHTYTPLIMSVFAAFIVMLVSVVFILYDRAVKVESDEKQVALDIKRQFVRYISHEIRTPMNTVCLGMTLLLSELQAELEDVEGASGLLTPASVGDWIVLANDVMESAQSAVAVLNDLLNYDRIEMGNLDLDVSLLDISHLVENTVKAFHLQARQARVSMSVHLGEWRQECSTTDGCNLSIVQAIGDGVKLTQVVRNLVSNALKFTSAGGQVLVSAMWKPDGLSNVLVPKLISNLEEQKIDGAQQEGSFVLTVTDTGAGLTNEQVKVIFAEGTQFNVNKLQAGQGSGLGLCIAKGIVEQHGGCLSVSSPGLGKGACFTMEIPVFRVIPSHKCTDDLNGDLSRKHRWSGIKVHSISDVDLVDESEIHSSDASATSNSDAVAKVSSGLDASQAHKILVVDDAPLNRKLLSRLLTSQGHQCIEAENGQEAVDMFTSCNSLFPFHTILMDSEMPVMNGPDATKKLRENGCTCLIVGVTGNVLAEDIEYFKSMGADAVLPKPFSIPSLIEIWEDSYV